jgi:hypothetical protein
MALLKAGYWQTTYWPSNYWQEDYWPEYGTAAPPVTVTVGDTWIRRKAKLRREPAIDTQFLVLLQDYLMSEIEGEK